jgi:hypothetical protein
VRNLHKKSAVEHQQDIAVRQFGDLTSRYYNLRPRSSLVAEVGLPPTQVEQKLLKMKNVFTSQNSTQLNSTVELGRVVRCDVNIAYNSTQLISTPSDKFSRILNIS